MELFYRRRARIVAYVDLILTIVALIFIILATVGVAFLTGVANDPDLVKKINEKISNSTTDQDATFSQEELSKSVVVIWISLVVFAIFTIIQLWAAVKLLHATEIEKEYTLALEGAKKWVIVTITFLIVSCLIDILLLKFISMVITIIIRGIFLYIVHKFRQEVLTLQSSTIPNPTMVTVKQ